MKTEETCIWLQVMSLVRGIQGEKRLKEKQAIEEMANLILQKPINSVVRYRLLRDALQVKPDSETLIDARQGMLESRWVQELEGEQRQDGGWGRFHSATRSKGEIATTEAAVERGLALGLEASDPIFHTTTNYLTRLLEEKAEFPDVPDRNNRARASSRIAQELLWFLESYRIMSIVQLVHKS